jgi:phosphoribosylamine-glycine ligase
VRAAQKRAYDAVEQVRCAGLQYRKDIGFRAIKTGGTAGKGPKEIRKE